MKRRIQIDAWIEEDRATAFLLACHRDGLEPGEVLAELVEGSQGDGLDIVAERARTFYSYLAGARRAERPATFPQWLDRQGRLEEAGRLASKGEGILEQIDALLDAGVPSDDAEVCELRAKERAILEPLARMFEGYRGRTGTKQEFRDGLADLAEYLLWVDVTRQDLQKKEGREDG